MSNSVFKEIVLVVNGEKITFDEDQFIIDDVSEDQRKVSAQMAYCAAVWASAEEEKVNTDSFYRKWRAEFGKAALEADPKKAEWKVRQDLESNEKFLKLKEALGIATKNVILMKGIFEAYRIKANALQSKGAMMRAELDSTGMTTKREKVVEKKEKRKKKEKKRTKLRIERMKETFNKEKKGEN